MVNFNSISNHLVSFFKETIPSFITSQNKKIQSVFFTIIDFLNPSKLVRRDWKKTKNLNKENNPKANNVKEIVSEKEPFKVQTEQLKKAEESEPRKFAPKKCTNKNEIFSYLKQHPSCKGNKKINAKLLAMVAKHLTNKQFLIRDNQIAYLESELYHAIPERDLRKNFTVFYNIRQDIANALFDYASKK